MNWADYTEWEEMFYLTQKQIHAKDVTRPFLRQGSHRCPECGAREFRFLGMETVMTGNKRLFLYFYGYCASCWKEGVECTQCCDRIGIENKQWKRCRCGHDWRLRDSHIVWRGEQKNLEVVEEYPVLEVDGERLEKPPAKITDISYAVLAIPKKYTDKEIKSMHNRILGFYWSVQKRKAEKGWKKAPVDLKTYPWDWKG